MLFISRKVQTEQVQFTGFRGYSLYLARRWGGDFVRKVFFFFFALAVFERVWKFAVFVC